LTNPPDTDISKIFRPKRTKYTKTSAMDPTFRKTLVGPSHSQASF
jgi:hypothetical protein